MCFSFEVCLLDYFELGNLFHYQNSQLGYWLFFFRIFGGFFGFFLNSLQSYESKIEFDSAD